MHVFLIGVLSLLLFSGCEDKEDALVLSGIVEVREVAISFELKQAIAK